MDILRRDVRFLKLYSVAMTACCAVIVLTGFTRQDATQAFVEIDVERINIVEPDGTLRMVISNQERQHPGIDGPVERDRRFQVEPTIVAWPVGDC